MKLNEEQIIIYNSILGSFLSSDIIQELKNYKHHGAVTIYDHCDHVARVTYYLTDRFGFRVNYQDLLIGAFLHDFYLYDWHELGDGSHKLHGFKHPLIASNNAKKYFEVNDKVSNIIKSHMWPLTFTKIPKSKEAFIVTIADKYCTIAEALFQRKKVKPLA